MSETTNTFKKASKRQLRFTHPKGLLTTEDLWKLRLLELDSIAVKIDQEISAGTKSFLQNPDEKESKEQKDNELRLEILKVIISDKEEENRAAYNRAARAIEIKHLQEALLGKKEEGLKAMDEATILARLEELKKEA